MKVIPWQQQLRGPSMDRDYIAEFEAGLVGKAGTLKRVVYEAAPGEVDWDLELDGRCRISIGVPWRLVANGGIFLGSQDDGHLFGRDKPLDVEEAARELLEGKTITKAVLDRLTADLTVTFSEHTRLDIFNASCGHEGWQASGTIGDRGMLVVALGGGGISIG